MPLPSRFHATLLMCIAVIGLLCGAAPAAEPAPPEEPVEKQADEPAAEKEVDKQDAAPAQYQRPVLIRFNEDIDYFAAHYLCRQLEAAEAADADLIVIEITSPGGIVSVGFGLADLLQEVETHTVAYVPHAAMSAAAFVALGCDDIVMDPKAMLGDAGTIELIGDKFEHVPEKVLSVVSLKAYDLAKRGGRPPALAQAMVDKDLIVWKVRNTKTGTITYMSEQGIAASGAPEQWEKLNQVRESAKDKFLTVNGERAVELKLASATAESVAELKKLYGIEEFSEVYEWTWVDTFALLLNWWPVTILLFLVGIIALYIEFSAPGIGIGGLTALLCFALFFWSRFLGGTAGWLEIMLFVAGLMFIAVELFVLPGFGVAGLSGVLLLLASLVMASQGTFDPESPEMWRTLTKNLLVLASAGVMSAISVVWLSSRMGTLPVFNRLILRPPAATETTDEPGEDEPEPDIRIGNHGVAQSALRPAGKAQFGKEYVDVVTDGDFIDHGAKVEIMEIIGNRIVVREIA